MACGVWRVAGCGIHDAGFVMRDTGCVFRESHERFEPFADDIDVRKFRFVWQDFPGGIEQRLSVDERWLMRISTCD